MRSEDTFSRELTKVKTELETNRYHLDDAKQRRLGWGRNDMLQAAKFDKWQKDPQAAFHTDVMEALRGIYVWQHQKNKEMQRREAAAWNAIGTITPVIEDLGLDDRDIRDREEGMRRILNAQHLLDRLIRDLTEVASAQPSEASPPAKANVGAEPVEANRQENSDAQEALAIGMKPSFGVRTIWVLIAAQPPENRFSRSTTPRDGLRGMFGLRSTAETDTSMLRLALACSPIGTSSHAGICSFGCEAASVDVFAEVRDQIERVVLTSADERDIGRYALSLPTADIGEPFDAEQGAERRIR